MYTHMYMYVASPRAAATADRDALFQLGIYLIRFRLRTLSLPPCINVCIYLYMYTYIVWSRTAVFGSWGGKQELSCGP